MNKSILTITAILSLGTVGCAGVGTHTQVASTDNPPPGASLQYAAGGGLGSLWDSPAERPSGLEQRVALDAASKSDLWTPASTSVAPSWAHDPAKTDPKAALSTTTTKLKF